MTILNHTKLLTQSDIYENGVCIPTETLELNDKQQVIITVLDMYEPVQSQVAEKQRRMAVLQSLSGIIPSTITDEDVKMCRMVR